MENTFTFPNRDRKLVSEILASYGVIYRAISDGIFTHVTVNTKPEVYSKMLLEPYFKTLDKELQ